MTNNKQSSVEWLAQLIKETNKEVYSELFDKIEQAKAMHKEEIKDSVGVGSQFDRDYLYGYYDKAEQYYNETFGGNNEQQ